MPPLKRIGITLLLAACGGSDNAPLAEGIQTLALADALTTCESLTTPEAKSWCALQALESTTDLQGVEAALVCPRLPERDASDRCRELAVRTPTNPAGSKTCHDVSSDLLRYSCWLSVADQVMTADLDHVLDTCSKTGTLLEHCISHIPTHRLPLWYQTGLQGMTNDIQIVLDSVEGLENSQRFGYAVGNSAKSLGAAIGILGPCDAFRFGEGKLACDNAISPGRAKGQNLPQGSQGNLGIAGGSLDRVDAPK